jgi:lysophospholipase L1-like esterase
MMLPFLALSLALLSSPALAQAGAPAPAAQTNAAPAAQTNPATTAVPRPDEWWQARYNAMNERVGQGKVELVFVGDSITQGWEGEGAALWAERYAPRHAVNLGISGDQTEHVLWRLEHGNFEGITPKAAVIMIGTNNVGNTNGAHSAEQIAAGVTAIVAIIGKASPGTRILLLAIFPRGEKPNPMRDTITAINARLAKLADGKKVVYLDLGPKFLAVDGTLPAELMPDFLHLSAKGYAVWADAIESDLAKLLGEK